MLLLGKLDILESKDELEVIPQGKVLINTINAHSFNTAQRDELFAEALRNGDYLIPDGASIVKACRWLKCKSQPRERVAGWDLFEFEMGRLDARGGRCMFMGSLPKVLALIVERAKAVYPNIEVVTYSPPYKPEFIPLERPEGEACLRPNFSNATYHQKRICVKRAFICLLVCRCKGKKEFLNFCREGFSSWWFCLFFTSFSNLPICSGTIRKTCGSGLPGLGGRTAA